MLQLNI